MAAAVFGGSNHEAGFMRALMASEFYVYLLYRDVERRDPFYVGKGKHSARMKEYWAKRRSEEINHAP